MSRRAIAAAVASAFALANGAALASTVVVQNCDDDGPGSLRAAVATAGVDTVDLSTLTCSRISLRTGAIVATQDNLTLIGPTATPLAINAKYQSPDRALKHTGSGTLTVRYLRVERGSFSPSDGPAYGGCIYSAGSVSLDHATVINCGAGARYARGGGVYARNAITLRSSTLAYNSAVATVNQADGGGAFCGGNFVMKYSTITNNTARGSSGNYGYGGGFAARGNVLVSNSTISTNHAGGNVGGIDVIPIDPASTTVDIIDSTVSGNSAGGFFGGVYVGAASINIEATTIAFNVATKGTFMGKPYAPGLFVGTGPTNTALTLQGALISNNTYGNGAEYDFSVRGNPSAAQFTVTGGGNLVRVASDAHIPPGTMRDVCPLLGPLRDNGGPTATHALQSGSPAIDHGDAAGQNNDQRGPPFARVSGAAADVGAYEVQQNDVVFDTSFEGCDVPIGP